MEAKSSKSPFCVAFCKETRPRTKDQKMDGINSMMKFYRHILTSFQRLAILQIIATQSTDFVTAKNMQSMEAKCVREGLHKCCASHRINNQMAHEWNSSAKCGAKLFRMPIIERIRIRTNDQSSSRLIGRHNQVHHYENSMNAYLHVSRKHF